MANESNESNESNVSPEQAAPSAHAARPGRVRWGLALVLVGWQLLLYVAISGVPQRLLQGDTVMYNHSGAVRNHGYALSVVLTLLGVAVYIAPVIVGAMARTWPGALAFMLGPLWLAQLFTLATSFAGAVPSPLTYGAGYVQMAQLGIPIWQDAARGNVFIYTALIFTILGTVGWAVRRAWTHEFFAAR